jgi:cytochrome P450
MDSTSKRVPPGPVESYETSQDLLGWMRDQFNQFGDIYKASAYGIDIYAINNPQYAQHVLRKNWQNYTKGFAIKRVGFLLGNGLMVSEGEFWKTQRKMIQPAFHRNVIGSLTDVIRAVNEELLNGWELAAQKNEGINITRDISLMVLKSVLLSIFGDDYGRVAPHFRVLSDEAARDLHFAQTFRSLRNIVVEVAADRRRQNIDAADFLGLLMKARDAEDGQVMSDTQLTNEIMTLVVAGHETTASTLNWMWYLLSQNPGVEDLLEREIDQLPEDEFPAYGELPKFAYTRWVIEETLRLYPAGWLMTRRALKDDQLGEYFVPAGTEIYISPYFMQRHPALWDAPDRFDPDRFSPDRSRERPELALLPFSAGPRNCIGELFARVEMQIHLMMVAKRLRLRYVGGEPELDLGVNLRSKHDFVMIPEIKPRTAVDGAASGMSLLTSSDRSALSHSQLACANERR